MEAARPQPSDANSVFTDPRDKPEDDVLGKMIVPLTWGSRIRSPIGWCRGRLTDASASQPQERDQLGAGLAVGDAVDLRLTPVALEGGDDVPGRGVELA